MWIRTAYLELLAVYCLSITLQIKFHATKRRMPWIPAGIGALVAVPICTKYWWLQRQYLQILGTYLSYFILQVEEGNIEYKLKLVNPNPSRLEHLVTQMKWRLREGWSSFKVLTFFHYPGPFPNINININLFVVNFNLL